MTVTEQTTTWHLSGKGYEFCNCAPGCTCNFSGFPSSSDGSCKAFVGNFIDMPLVKLYNPLGPGPFFALMAGLMVATAVVSVGIGRKFNRSDAPDGSA